MRIADKLVTATVLLVTATSPSITPASSVELEYIGSTLWSGLSDVKVVGDLVYCAGPYGLSILDISDPLVPKRLSHLFIEEGWGQSVDVAGDRAYLADGHLGFHIIDISDPTSPVLISTLADVPRAICVAYYGDYAIVGDDRGRFSVLDITDEQAPTVAYTHQLSGKIKALLPQDSVLLVIAHAFGLHIFDMSDPTVPIEISSLQTPGFAFDLAVAGERGYLADASGGLHVLDLSDYSNPHIDTTYMPRDIAHAVGMQGDLVYVTAYTKGLEILDVSNPLDPQLIGFVEAGPLADVIVAKGTTVYVGSSGELETIDVHDPSNPTIASVTSYSDASGRLQLDGNALYVLGLSGGLSILDVGTAGVPHVVGAIETRPNPRSMYVDDTVVYVSSLFGGLELIGVSDPLNPTSLGHVQSAGESYQVRARNGYAYVASGWDGLTVVDVHDPAAPSVVTRYTPGTYTSVFALFGDYAYVGLRCGTLDILSLLNPAAPSLLSRIEATFCSGSIDIVGDSLYTLESGALAIWDFQNPTAPTLISTTTMPGGPPVAVGIDVHDSLAIISGSDHGAHVYSISDPLNPTWLTTYNTPGFAGQVALVGDRLFVADTYGLLVLRLTAGSSSSIGDDGQLPVTFELGHNYPNPFNAGTAFDLTVSNPSHVRITVFNVLGQRVATLVDDPLAAGDYNLKWDGLTSLGVEAPSGVYFYRLVTSEHSQVRKMLLLR